MDVGVLVDRLREGHILDNFPGIHDVDPVGITSHHSQVMGNDDQGYALFSGELFQELQYLGLNGYVKCRCQLVGQSSTLDRSS